LPFDTEENENFLQKIFELDDNNKFKPKSLKYQYILKALLTYDSGYFKITAIQENVLYEASQLFKVDVTKKPFEIKKNQNPQFNKYLANLEKWKLIVSRPATSLKGGIQTKAYALTKLGMLFAVMIDFILSEKKQDNDFDKLFNFWISYLSDYSSSLDLFCITYIEICKKFGVFNELAEFYIKNILYNENSKYITTFTDLFTKMTLVRVEDRQRNKTLFELWQLSFYQLDNAHQILFVHHLSNYINRISIMEVIDIATFEMKRFGLRNLGNKIIAEFCCSFCKSDCKYVDLDILSYVSCVFNQPNEKAKGILDNLKCEHCRENRFEMMMIS
jgi:hypothetical protein